MRIPANRAKAKEAGIRGWTSLLTLVPVLLLLGASPAFPVRPAALSPAPPLPAPAGKYRPPYQLGWADAGLAGGGALFGLFALHRYLEMDPVPIGSADPSGLPAFDRWAAGNYSLAAILASDVVMAPLLVAPMGLLALEAFRASPGTERGERWKSFLVETVILGEAMVISSSLNLTVRSLKLHPRPLVYGSDAPVSEKRAPNAAGSFYSGHANAAFLLATYLSTTYPRRHPEFRHGGWLWAGSLGTAAAVAGLRVSAGKHFPSDVVVGAAVGAAFGYLFPRMHETKNNGGFELGLGAGAAGIYPRLAYRF